MTLLGKRSFYSYQKPLSASYFFWALKATVSQSPDLLNVGSTSHIKSIVLLIAGYWREKF